MWIVDPKNLHPVLAPESYDPQHLLQQSTLIGSVKIDRIDILVLLGRVLGVLDASVWPMMEPLRMLANPRMVRRALDCEVQRHLNSKTVGGRVEAVEVAKRPQRRINRHVPPGLAANRPRTAGRIRSSV